MIEGAIFDMDGVLLDNVNYHLRAWQHFGREQGMELSEEEILAVFGQRNREILKALLKSPLSDDELLRLGNRKEEIYRSLLGAELERAVVPALTDFLVDLEREGLRLAVATSGPPENANFALEGLKIVPFFKAVITGQDVQRSKPDPEIFLLAAQRLGLSPGRCVVFEDSASGIRAAREAGCLCVGVATTHNVQELQQFSPTCIIRDFRDIRAGEIKCLDGNRHDLTEPRPDGRGSVFSWCQKL